jgi:acetyl-CoA acetyltransferase
MGGAIAFGHPNGASGAGIGMFAMRHLIRNNAGTAFSAHAAAGAWV